jgi:hypothetical protein
MIYLELHGPLNLNIEAYMLIKPFKSKLQSWEWLVVFKAFIEEAWLQIVFSFF